MTNIFKRFKPPAGYFALGKLIRRGSSRSVNAEITTPSPPTSYVGCTMLFINGVLEGHASTVTADDGVGGLTIEPLVDAPENGVSFVLYRDEGERNANR